MIPPTGPERDFEQAKLLLQEYSFDMGGFEAGALVAIWQERLGADPTWIRAAVLEALYQGRYKAFSVEQILQGWKRRGHPVRHFNSEFERVVFGPIDPTISKYALMTTLSPSELMTPQSEGRKTDAEEPTAAAIAPVPPPDQEAPPDVAAAPSEDEAGAASESATAIASEPDSLELPPVAIAAAPPNAADSPAATDDAAVAQAAASLFNQPEPIQKFTPKPESSEFYERLQAVARESQ